MNKTYDEVKRIAATVLPILQMGKAMDEMGEHKRALELLRDAYFKAENGLSKFDIEAMYIVYESASGPLCLYYLNNGMINEAIKLCATRIKYLKRIVHLTHAIRLCTVLLTVAHQTKTAFFAYSETPEGQCLLDENPDLFTLILRQIFSFMLVVSKEMEAIEPDSAYLEIVLPHINRFREEGYEFLKDASVERLYENMDLLAQNLLQL